MQPVPRGPSFISFLLLQAGQVVSGTIAHVTVAANPEFVSKDITKT